MLFTGTGFPKPGMMIDMTTIFYKTMAHLMLSLCSNKLFIECIQCTTLTTGSTAGHTRPWAVFIKQLKSNVYVSLSSIGSFRCYLYSHWLTTVLRPGAR